MATFSGRHPLLSSLLLLLSGFSLVLSTADAASLTQSDSYRVQPGDALLIDLLGESDFGGERMVGPQGTIALPVVGSLRVADMTLTEVREAITRALREFMEAPYVTVALNELNSKRRVYVSGRVEKIGSHMLPLGATIVEALAAAGLAEDADLSTVQVTRSGGETLVLNLSGLRTGEAMQDDLVVRWDDRVFVPRLEAYVTVVGRVQKPGSYLLPPGRPMRLLDLLTQVGGGMSEGAEYRVALLNREGGSEPERIDLAKLMLQGDMTQNHELRANDVLVIPEADRVVVAGEVAAPTAFVPSGPTRVLDALAKAGGFTPRADLRAARLTRADGQTVALDLEALWRRGDLQQNTELQPGDALVVPRADPEEVVMAGALAKPGAYDISDLKDRSLVRAITIAGTTDTTDLTRVSVFHGQEHRVCNVRAALETGDTTGNPTLEPGDVVYVPDSQTVLVIGAFARSGPQPYDPKLTLMDYIARAGGVIQGHGELGTLLRPLTDGTTEMVRLDLGRLHLGVVPEPVVIKPGDIIYVPIKAPKRDLWDKLRDFIVTLGAVDSLFR